jgi:pyruvate,water dikinase
MSYNMRLMDASLSDRCIIDLAEVHEEDRDLVGVKAYNLARGMAEGFPVPPAFVITTAAFTRFLEENDLAHVIARREVAISDDDPVAIRAVSEEVRNRILASEMPEAPRRAVSETYRKMFHAGGVPTPVAVRSSATLEDLDTCSMAGQHDSFLNVRGEEDLLEKIRACWASLWSERAIFYRQSRKLSGTPLSMAIVVQAMIPSRFSGILYTRSPVPERGDSMVLELDEGLGDALASGLISPKRYYIARRDFSIMECSRGSTNTTVGEGVPRPDPSLTREQIAEVGRLGLRAEDLFGRPQDLEWAISEDGVYLLQSRPITENGLGRPAGFTLWTAANSQEALQDPVTPLTWSFHLPYIEKGRKGLFGTLAIPEIHEEEGYMKLFYGRPYFNTNYFRIFLKNFPILPHDIFDRLIFGEKSMEGLSFSRSFAFSRMNRVTMRALWLALRMRWGAKEKLDAFIDRFNRRYEELRRIELARMDTVSLFAHMEKCGELMNQAFLRHALGSVLAGGHFLLLSEYLNFLGIRRAENFEGELLGGLEGMVTAEGTLRLFDLARLADLSEATRNAFRENEDDAIAPALEASSEGRDFLRSFRKFLDEYGHQSAREAELMEPRWRENPRFLLHTIKSYLGNMKAVDPYAKEQRIREKKRSLILRLERILSRDLLESYLPARTFLFRLLLRNAETYAPYRENLRFYGLKALDLARSCFRVIARRFHGKGWIEGEDDIFFLTLDEVRAIHRSGSVSSDLGDILRERRAKHERNLSTNPPHFLYEDRMHHRFEPADRVRPEERVGADFGSGSLSSLAGAPSSLRDRSGHSYLEGVPVSTGRITGPVRVVEYPEEAFSLKRDEILVAKVANPGWTPLFFLAKGVILDVGGLLSHAAVLAREFGIPCVVGVGSGTLLLRTGEIVTLDGDTGRVYLPPQAAQREPAD